MNKFRIAIILFFLPGWILSQNQVDNGASESNLIEALDRFQNEYDLEFAYDPAILHNYQIKSYSLDCEEWEICLKILLSQTDLEYKRNDKKILLRPRQGSGQKIKVYGTVSDEEGNALPYATIEVIGTSIGSYTDDKGAFYMEYADDVDKQTVIQINYLGYETQTLVIIPSQSQKINARLKVKTTLLEDVVISKSKPTVGLDLTQNKNIYRKDSSYYMPTALNGDLFLGAQLFPGIDGQTKYKGGLRIRGGRQDESLVVLDEIQLFKSHHLSGLFSLVNSSYIERYSLYKSIFPVKYGGKTAGILAMDSEKIFQKPRELDISLGYLTTDAQVSLPLSKKVSFLFNGRTTNDFIGENKILNQHTRDDLDNKPGLDDDFSLQVIKPAYRFQDYFSKLSIKPRTNFSLDLAGFYSRDDYDYLLENTVEIDRKNKDKNSTLIQSQSEEFKANNQGFSAQTEYQFSSSSKIEATASTSSYESNLLNNNQWTVTGDDQNRAHYDSIYLRNKVSTSKLRIDWQKQTRLSSTFTIGSEVEWYRTDAENSIKDRAFISQVESNGNLYSAYGNWLQNWRDRLMINAGARASSLSGSSSVYFSPRVLVSYKPSYGLTFSTGWARYHQYLREQSIENIYGNIYEYWIWADDSEIPVGHTNQYTAGLNYISGNFTINVEAYSKYGQNVLRNFLTTAPNRPGGDKPDDLKPAYRSYSGESTNQGIDLLIKYDRDRHTSMASYSLSRSLVRFDQYNRGQSFYDETDSPHQIKLSHYQSLGTHWRVFGQYVFASGNPYFDVYKFENFLESNPSDGDRDKLNVSDYQSRLPSYHRLDIGGSYTWRLRKMDIELGATIYNLTNHQNLEYLQYTAKTENDVNNRYFGTKVEQNGITPDVYLRFRF